MGQGCVTDSCALHKVLSRAKANLILVVTDIDEATWQSKINHLCMTKRVDLRLNRRDVVDVFWWAFCYLAFFDVIGYGAAASMKPFPSPVPCF